MIFRGFKGLCLFGMMRMISMGIRILEPVKKQ